MEGVKRLPCSLGMMVVFPSTEMANTDCLVPKSMPIIFSAEARGNESKMDNTSTITTATFASLASSAFRLRLENSFIAVT